MIKFEIGKSYSMRSIGDHDCIWSYTVIDRTAQTITLEDEAGQVKKCRVIKKLSEFDGRECLKPLGNYSLAPTLRAN